jgi:hypothetical protein
MNSAGVINEILMNNPTIVQIELLEYPLKKVLQERLELTEPEKKQITRALAIRELIGLPFWESLLLTFFANDKFSERLLVKVKDHNEHVINHRLKVRETCLEDYLKSKSGVNIALSSKVELAGGEERHIPLLDFHCPNTPNNLVLASEVIYQLDIGGGYLLESGDSYHFYGITLFTKDDFIRFMGLALQYSPIVDKTWIAHQLREMASALRITPKHDITPFLVKRLGETSTVRSKDAY